MEKMLVNVFLPFAVLLLKCNFITAARSIIAANINICENVDDHIFLQDFENCSKYIVCVNGEAKSQQCQTGLYFDVYHQACTGSKLSCLQCPSDSRINIPLLKTCDKYISCYYGQSLLRKCNTNQQFNVKTGKCDFKRNVDCVENRCSIYATDKKALYVPSAGNCSNYYVCQAGQVKIQTCNEGFYFSQECNCCDNSENVQCLFEDLKTPAKSTKQNRLSVNFSKIKQNPTLIGETNQVKCPPIGHFLYQYIEDTAYYFTCVEGKATLYSCPTEQLFDDKLKRCVSKEKELNKDEQKNAEMDIECPMIGTTTLPHAEKNQYYICIEGKSQVFACADGLFYDANIKSCSQYYNTDYNNNVYSPQINTNAVSVKCPKLGTLKFGHENNNKFYLCVDGNTYILSCAENEVFDAFYHTCRVGNEIEGNASKISYENHSSSLLAEVVSNFICPKQGTFMYPHVQKNHYYICIDGIVFNFACAEDHVFDTVTNTCRNGETLNNSDDGNNQTPQVLDEPADILCPPIGAMKFAHKEKQKFYLCVNGMASILACAEGSFFEPQAGICRRTFDLMTAAVDTITEENAMENISTDQYYSFECPKSGTFIYAHAEENMYFVCLDGKPLDFSCPEDLIFDKEKKICSAAIQMENFVNPNIPTSENEEENIEHNASNAEEYLVSVAHEDDVAVKDEQ